MVGGDDGGDGGAAAAAVHDHHGVSGDNVGAGLALWWGWGWTVGWRCVNVLSKRARQPALRVHSLLLLLQTIARDSEYPLLQPLVATGRGEPLAALCVTCVLVQV